LQAHFANRHFKICINILLEFKLRVKIQIFIVFLHLFTFLRARTMYRIIPLILALVITLVLAVQCDEGLVPPPIPPVTTLSGTVRYLGGKANWPRRDSVWTVRVVGFREFPPRDLIGEILQGRAYFTPAALQLDSTLALFADSARYTITFADSVPPRIEYLCVAMLIDTTRILTSAGWRVIGVYSQSGNNRQPSQVPLTVGRSHTADMTVDFKNFPPQPF
jgi:hypothetical protein